LSLFLAQLHGDTNREERERLLGRIEAAVTAMNELFNALLDISKLDAGALALNRTDFPIARLLSRIEASVAGTARARGLQLRIVQSSAWVHSDFILLERILLNFASNAVRYTKSGGIVIGCRHRGESLRIDVCDTGIGIPEDQRRYIFSEFYQIAGPQRSDGHGGLGLGLGLSIVERLGRLLNHPIEVASNVGRGSRFSVTIPIGEPAEDAPSNLSALSFDPLNGKIVLVIDDDELIRDSMGGLLRNWGCRVLTAGSSIAALTQLAEHGLRPDLIISDYHLANGMTGIAAVAQIRSATAPTIPAFLVTGDTAAERMHDANASGLLLLHKPVAPMTLRALVSRLLRDTSDDRHSDQRAPQDIGATGTSGAA
jgi:CheY-like chemotaxis protein